MVETNMYDNVLKQAFKEYMEESLDSDIYREDEFETSKAFEKKIAKMIKSQHNVYHKLTLTRARKVLCIAAIIIAILLSTLSVGAVRDFVANFFVKHFSTHDSISADTEEGTYPTKLEKIYELGYIPEGYELADKSVTDNDATYIYNSKNDSLLFVQSTKDAFASNLDNENSSTVTENYKGQEYYISDFKYDNNSHIITVVWDNGKYIFELSAELPKKTMLDLCDSLKIKQK